MRTRFFQKASVFLTAGLFCLATCERDKAPLGPDVDETMTLTLDEIVYYPADTVVVTFRNHGGVPVFLEGCNPIYLGTKTDTGWIETPTRVCEWEGYARKVLPAGTYQERHEARWFRGAHKFVAPVYSGCVDDQPISQARCTQRGKVYSSEFSVVGYEDAMGVLTIVPDKVEYTWGPDDLGSTRHIEATLFNNSDNTYYANLGDRFYSSIDQDRLFVAESSGGFIEKFNLDGSWNPMPRAMLIEGVRYIALRPQRSYRLLAPLASWQGDETGYFRIKVEYFDQLEPPQDASAKVDYSVVFVIP